MSKLTRHKIVGDVRWEPTDGGRIRLLGGWQEQNIVTVHIPQLVGVQTYGTKSKGNIQWHKGTSHQVKGFFQEVEDKGLSHLLLFWDGSFVPRMVRGSTRTPSNHTFGTAFDINAEWNGLGVYPPLPGKKGSVRPLVQIAANWGFFWGGNYRSRKDGMHFEVARVLPASAVKPAVGHTYSLILNSKKIADMPVRNGKSLAPVRATLSALGLGANYRAATKTVVVFSLKTGDLWGELTEKVENVGGVGHVPITELVPFVGLRYTVNNENREVLITR